MMIMKMKRNINYIMENVSKNVKLVMMDIDAEVVKKKMVNMMNA
jgi:hypothetical protein